MLGFYSYIVYGYITKMPKILNCFETKN